MGSSLSVSCCSSSLISCVSEEIRDRMWSRRSSSATFCRLILSSPTSRLLDVQSVSSAWRHRQQPITTVRYLCANVCVFYQAETSCVCSLWRNSGRVGVLKSLQNQSCKHELPLCFSMLVHTGCVQTAGESDPNEIPFQSNAPPAAPSGGAVGFASFKVMSHTVKSHRCVQSCSH